MSGDLGIPDEHLQDELRSLVIDLDHVDATIHLFDPTVEPCVESVDMNGPIPGHSC